VRTVAQDAGRALEGAQRAGARALVRAELARVRQARIGRSEGIERTAELLADFMG
jgi:hypothetical protein